MDLVAYCRVSSIGQKDNLSLETQLRAITGYVELHGHQVGMSFQEIQSGAKFGRAELFQALRLLVCKKCDPGKVPYGAKPKAIFEALERRCRCRKPVGYDGLIAFDLDRVGRDAQILLWLGFDFLNRLGKHLIVLNGLGQCDTTTPHGRFMFGQFALVAQFYRENLLERTNRGRQEKAEKRLYVGGCPPFGLRREGNILVPDEAQAAILEEMHRLKSIGFTYRDIADWLNEIECKTRFGKAQWKPGSVWNAMRKKKLTEWVDSGYAFNYLDFTVEKRKYGRRKQKAD